MVEAPVESNPSTPSEDDHPVDFFGRSEDGNGEQESGSVKESGKDPPEPPSPRSSPGNPPISPNMFPRISGVLGVGPSFLGSSE